jgi:hypothetical protein
MDLSNEFGSDDFMKGRYAGDVGVHARFYTVMVHNEEESAKAGRPIHIEKEFIEIIASGNPNNIIRRKASDEDRQRFRRQYEIFGRDRDATGEQLVGTPLVEVPWLSKPQVHELAYIRVHTLEQLSSLDDNTCSRFAGMYDLKRKALAAVEAANKAAPMTEMALQMEQMRAQLEDLLAQNKELKSAKSK